MRLNPSIKNPNLIYPGQVFKLSGGSKPVIDLVLTITRGKYDAKNNRTRVGWHLYIQRRSGSRVKSGHVNSAKCVVNGKTVLNKNKIRYDFSGRDRLDLGYGGIYVDGFTDKISVSGSFNDRDGKVGSGSVSGSIPMPMTAGAMGPQIMVDDVYVKTISYVNVNGKWVKAVPYVKADGKWYIAGL